MNRETLDALLHDTLPVTYRRFRLERAEPGTALASDGGVTVRLCLHDDDTGESVEQTVPLVPAGEDPERADAYVRAWARSLPSLLDCVAHRAGQRFVEPRALGFPLVVLRRSEALTTAQFVEEFTDPAAAQAWAAAADAADSARKIRDVCRELGWGAHADALVALGRPGIELVPHPAGTGAGGTCLGGLPELPPGVAWPHRAGHAMTFLARIDLAEVGCCDDDRLLPRSGLLQIFADLSSGVPWGHPGDGPGVLVMTVPADTGGCAVAQAPAGTGVFPRRAVVPAADLSLPPLDGPFYGDLTDLDLADGDPAAPGDAFAAFVGFLNEFHPPLDDADRPRHRLLGYADPLQGDPWAECAAAEPGVPPTRWQLLAQIDSEPGAALGDGGLVHVFVPRDALEAGDFARARGVWQTH